MLSIINSSVNDNNGQYTKYGECRCCMAKGKHRDVTKEYYFNNITEVYQDIFKECFNLPLSTNRRISKLICSNCIQRLREATSFRMMVVSTEKQLLDAVLNSPENYVASLIDNDPMTEVTEYSNGIKIEVDDETIIHFEPASNIFHDESETGFEGVNSKQKQSMEKKKKNMQAEYESYEESDVEDYDGDCFSTFSTSTTDDEQMDFTERELNFLSRFPKPPPLPKRSDLPSICPKYEVHLKKLQDQIVTAKSIEFILNKPEKNPKSEKCIYFSDKRALIANTTAIFVNSNATAFKAKMRDKYPCFYCRQECHHKTLRDHQNTHPKSEIADVLKKYAKDEIIVYADITNLKCTICNRNINNLTELKTHLMGEHNIKMNSSAPDRVIPFKLKDVDLECQLCGLKYETFGALEKHMTKHYGNFICELCGAGFITKHRLSVHLTVHHNSEKHTCSVCSKEFPTQHSYKVHYDGVHKMMKKVKCTKCNEKFIDYFTRKKHLIDVHGDEPVLYKCTICDRGFTRKFSLSCHVKRLHLGEKNVKCEFCSFTCFSNPELKEHMIKHNGLRPYECSICKKTFGRKKSFVVHARVHANDAKFTCAVCGSSFVHKVSLKTHMRTHQMDT